MSWIGRVVIAIYALILRLYPRRFREQFGEEMRAVFALALTEAAQRNAVSLAFVCLRELRDLPFQIAREHLSRAMQTMRRLFNYDKDKEVRLVRWLTRIVSLLASLLFLYTFAALAGVSCSRHRLCP